MPDDDDAAEPELTALFEEIAGYLKARRAPAPAVQEQVQVAVARYLAQQRERDRERLRAARLVRGAWDGQGSGPLPYGYVRVWDGQDGSDRRGRIVVDEAQAAVVRRIFELHAGGASVRRIAQHLFTEGVKTSRGAVFNAPSVAQILAHEELYRTGRRVYAGVEASLRWPTILA